VNPARAPLNQARISDQDDGGGKIVTRKSADCIISKIKDKRYKTQERKYED